MKRKLSTPGGKDRPIRSKSTKKVGKTFPLEPEVMPAEGINLSPKRKTQRPRYIEAELMDEPEEAENHAGEGLDDPEAAEESEIEAEASSSLALPGGAKLLTPEVQEIDQEMRAISPSDPLRRYLEEVRRHPLLAPEEEFQLAVTLRQTGDLEAAKRAATRMVQANLRLVVKIAFEYRSFYSNVLDLIQEGNVGLMKAVSKYDPTKGARFGYYASWWIRSYVLKYLLDNFRLVKIGTTQAQKKLFYHLMREKERLEAQGLLAGPKLLADRLNVREKDVIEMQQRLSGSGSELPLDAPVDRASESGATHLDTLAQPGEAVDDRLAREQLLNLLRDRLPEFEKTLNDKERRILQDRLLADEPKTLQEIADHYGLTRERARQIEAKMILKLQEFLRDSLGRNP